MTSWGKWGITPITYLKALSPQKHGKRVLDLGCGDGRNTIFMAQKGFHVVAVDTDLESLRALKFYSLEDHKNIDIVVSDIVDYMSYDLFDVVLLNFVLHFLSPEDVQKVLDHVVSFLRKDGILVISDFYGEGPLEHSKEYFWFTESEIAYFLQNNAYGVISETRGKRKTRRGYFHNGFEIVLQKN